MIRQLKGMLVEKHPPVLVLDVNGVGYELFVSMNTFYTLPEIGEALTLYTHMVVREDAQLLYGFHDQAEQKLFRDLIKVNGVGPKMALAILSNMNAENFVICINHHDVAQLSKIPGIGKKTAERLIIEMKDRLSSSKNIVTPMISGVQTVRTAMEDAISALVSLGYKLHEANRVISKLDHQKLSSEELIRQALQSM